MGMADAAEAEEAEVEGHRQAQPGPQPSDAGQKVEQERGQKQQEGEPGREPGREPEQEQEQHQQDELEPEPTQRHPMAGKHCHLPDCVHPNGFRVLKVEIVEETTTVHFNRPNTTSRADPDPAGPGQF